jgi:hypothetical protein
VGPFANNITDCLPPADAGGFVQFGLHGIQQIGKSVLDESVFFLQGGHIFQPVGYRPSILPLRSGDYKAWQVEQK